MSTLVVTATDLARVSAQVELVKDRDGRTLVGICDSGAPRRPGDEAVLPPVFLWHTAGGRKLHAEIERLCAGFARLLGDAEPAYAMTPRAVEFISLDALLYSGLVLHTLETTLERGGFDRVAVVTGDVSFFLSVARLAARYVQARAVLAVWTARPRFDAAPVGLGAADLLTADAMHGALWQARQQWRWLVDQHRLRTRELRQKVQKVKSAKTKKRFNLARWRRKVDKAFHRRLDAFKAWRERKRECAAAAPTQTITQALAKLPPMPVGGRAAVLGWLARDANYAVGLTRVLAEILPHRPCVVFLDAETAVAREIIDAFVDDLTDEHKARLEIISYPQILAPARGLAMGDAAVVAAAMRKAGRRDTRSDGAGALRALGQWFGADAMASSPHLRVVALAAAWIEALPASAKPAYGLFCSARSALFAALAEALARHGAPTADVHTYLIGNHARQIAPPTDFVAVIDDQQEGVVCDFWGWERDRALRIGYLWRAPGSAHSDEAQALRSADPARRLVAIFTQPGDPSNVEGFFSGVLAAMAQTRDAAALVKPHPAEGAERLGWYRREIERAGLEARMRVLDRATSVADMIEIADLVVTRTSNVGIEAGLRLRPTLRYVEHDLYDPSVQAEVAYADSARTLGAFIARFRQLLDDPAAAATLRERQRAYMAENPAQEKMDGAVRLVAHMEEAALRRGVGGPAAMQNSVLKEGHPS